MHEKITALEAELRRLSEVVKANTASQKSLFAITGNPTFAGFDYNDVNDEIEKITEYLKSITDEVAESKNSWLDDYISRITYLINNVVPSLTSNPHAGFVVMSTLWSCKNYMQDLSEPDEDNVISLRRATVRIRSLEATIRALEPRRDDLRAMVQRIENANETAERLPADLEQLEEARRLIAKHAEASQKSVIEIEAHLNRALNLTSVVDAREKESAALMAQLNTAYAAATSQGLAAAFEAKSSFLNWSILAWVTGLAIALGACAWAGSDRIRAILTALASDQKNSGVVTLHLLMAVFSVGPAIWFAWLSTKQIGQRFRLAEDYAFKAAVARAYEGFRKEAVRIDPELEMQLLRSALTRIDEQPLRFVETPAHGSPAHELLSSETIKDALKSVPGFLEKVEGIAQTALTRRKSGGLAATSPVSNGEATQKHEE